MPLDALCLSAVKTELTKIITDSKIDKIQQPERDVIILSLRGQKNQTHKLLISCGSGDSRIHLTDHKFDNPQSPPMFCMLLRKHTIGARISEIVQLPAERVIIIKLNSFTGLGLKSDKNLIIELIGGSSNLILTDETGIIIDCLRRIGGDLNDKRSVLPGMIYRNPPVREGKINPLEVSEKELSEAIKSTSDVHIDKWLNSAFTAFSPLICREISWRAYNDHDLRINEIKDTGEALIREFLTLIEQVKAGNYEPWLITDENNLPIDFSFTQIKQYTNLYTTEKEKTFSEMLDGFYTRSAQIKRINQRNSTILKLMSTARDRLVRKITTQTNELKESSNREYYRECGDIIAANYHNMSKGQQSLTADDFYSETNEKRTIKLDSLKTPQQNAAKYYKIYSKAKNAQKYLEEQIKTAEKELLYTESVTEQLKRAESEQDLNEIRNELTQTGYIKKKQQKTKQTESGPHRFKSSTGKQILVGRNNIQNDKLTFKIASKSDIWLHAQKIHGAHVIILCSGENPDDVTLQEAATIAAYFSAARADSKVSTDYTHVKNVKKTPASKPGMVIYNDYKTIIAEPDEKTIDRLRD